MVHDFSIKLRPNFADLMDLVGICVSSAEEADPWGRDRTTSRCGSSTFPESCRTCEVSLQDSLGMEAITKQWVKHMDMLTGNLTCIYICVYVYIYRPNVG